LAMFITPPERDVISLIRELLTQFRVTPKARIKRPDNRMDQRPSDPLPKPLKFAFQPLQVGVQFVPLPIS
jgi:hypothetical protein